MKLDGEFTFQATRKQVWDAILDPKVLATALPGAQTMEKIAEDEYQAVMQIRVGPVAGVFHGKVTLKDKVFPESYVMIIEGKGSPGFGKGTSTVEFSELENGNTLMKYSAQVEVGGRIASVGQRLLETVSKSMARQSLDAISNTLQKRLAADGDEKVDYRAPSQTKFALGVLKDLLLSKPIAWTAILALAAIIAYVIFRVIY